MLHILQICIEHTQNTQIHINQASSAIIFRWDGLEILQMTHLLEEKMTD